MSFDLAQVVHYYPQLHKADVIRISDGWRFPRLSILCEHMSNNTGAIGTPQPTQMPYENAVGLALDRVLFAVLGNVGGSVMIFGFLPPQTCEMLFADGRYVNRLASDVYVSVDQDGNIEVAHPSGTYFRIGETAEHEDLTGKDFNGRWKIRNNTDKAPHVKLSIGSGGEEKASFHIDPSGDLSVSTIGNMTVSGKQVSVTAEVVSVAAPESTFAGDLTVTGLLTTAGFAVIGSDDHPEAAISVPLNSTSTIHAAGNITGDADVVAQGTSLHEHAHEDSTGHPTSAPL